MRFISAELLLGPLGQFDLAGIGWVIVGGESGPGFRPMDPAWALALRDQCVAAGVPFFFKQWSAYAPKKAGRLLAGQERSQMPVAAAGDA